MESTSIVGELATRMISLIISGNYDSCMMVK